MKNYTTLSDGTSTKTAEQIENTTGVKYRASGNLFIAKETSITIPKDYVGNRGDIVGFSAGSGIRMRRYLRECQADYEHMVTLTYPCEYPSNGAESKEHLRRFLQEVQRWDKRHFNAFSKLGDGQEHSAFWFLEFQGRGAPHYHIFLNRCPPKEWVAKRWYEIVNSEDIRHLHAGTRTERLLKGRAGTISYASKYANKAEQKAVPIGYENVGRFWGVYGHRVTMAAATFVSATDNKRSDVKQCVNTMEMYVQKVVKQGLGEVIKSDNGLYVVVIHDTHAMMRIRMYVSAISVRLNPLYYLFEDAEVDYGECYGL